MNLSTTGLRLTAGAPIDLHMHTIYSDGRWTPESLLDHLLREQFSLAAITDHDRPATAAAVQRLARSKRLPVLVAVEMTSTWQGEMVDLLCYGFDPTHSALSDLAQDLRRRQEENSRQVYENLHRQGYRLPPAALAAILAQPSARHPHAWVTLLREHGHGLGEPTAGRIAFEAGCTYATSDPAAVAKAAHHGGGACLLAHPGRGNGFVTFDAQRLDQFRREVPIDGMEVHHPSHTPAQAELFRNYAQRHKLLTSAGSDSHGPEKPPIQCRAEWSRSLLERLGIQIEESPASRWAGHQQPEGVLKQ